MLLNMSKSCHSHEEEEVWQDKGRGLDRGQSQDQLEDSHFGGNMLASFGREGAVHKRGGKNMDLIIFVFSSCMHGKFVIPRTILVVTV